MSIRGALWKELWRFRWLRVSLRVDHRITIVPDAGFRQSSQSRCGRSAARSSRQTTGGHLHGVRTTPPRPVDLAAPRGSSVSWRRGLLVAGVAFASIAVVAAALLLVRSSERATAIAQTSRAAPGHAPCPGARHDQSSRPVRQGRTALDPRLRALIAVFRRAPSAADRSAMATCAAVESGVPLRFVRYVGRGILGGEMFVFPVPTGARPSGPASGGVSDGEPAACLITVRGLPVAGQIDGCASLSDIRRPPDHWTAAEIFPGIGGPAVFAVAGVPKRLRHGSLLGSVVRDRSRQLTCMTATASSSSCGYTTTRPTSTLPTAHQQLCTCDWCSGIHAAV